MEGRPSGEIGRDCEGPRERRAGRAWAWVARGGRLARGEGGGEEVEQPRLQRRPLRGEVISHRLHRLGERGRERTSKEAWGAELGASS